MADQTSERPSYEHIAATQKKYLRLFTEYPHFTVVGSGILTDDDGNIIKDANGEDAYGITLGVSEITDPETLPFEMRIPECLDGVPVKIVRRNPRLL
jgi:hypothetical protein